jgi:hypothetical protein
MYRLVTHYERQRDGKNVLKPDTNWEEELRGDFYRKYVQSFNGCSVWIPETEYKVHNVPANFTHPTPRTGHRLYYDTNSTSLLSYTSFRAKMIAGTSITEEQFDYWDHLTNFWEQHSFHLNNDAYVSSNIYHNGNGTSTVYYTSYRIQKEIDLMLNADADEFIDATSLYYKNNINTFQNQFPAVNHNMSIHLLALKINGSPNDSYVDNPEIYHKIDDTKFRIEMTETRIPSSYVSLASEIRFDFVKKVAGNINTVSTEKSNGNLIAESYSRFNKKRPLNFSWVYANQNEKNFDWSIFDESIKNRPSAVYNEDLTAHNHWIIDMTYWKTKYQLFFRKAFVLSADPNFHQGKIIEYPWNPTGRYKTNNIGIPGTPNINFGDYPLIDYIVDRTHPVSDDPDYTNFNEWEYLLYTVFGNLQDFRSEMLFKLKDLGSIMLRYFPEGTVRTHQGRPDNYDEQRDGPLVMGLGSFDWGVDGSKGFLWDPTCYGLTKNEDIKWFHLNGGINSTAPFVLISRIDFGGKFPTMENNDNYCFFKTPSSGSSSTSQNDWDVIYDKTNRGFGSQDVGFGFRYYKYFINMKWLSEASEGKITKLNHTRWNFWNLDSSLRTSGRLGIGYWKYPHAFDIPEAHRNRSKENGQWSPLILKTFNLFTLDDNHPLKKLGDASVVNNYGSDNFYRTSLRHNATPSGGVVFSLTDYANNPNYSYYTLSDSDENNGYKHKRFAIEYLSEYMRQNDYHSCTFLYYDRKPYLHFVARDYVVRERYFNSIYDAEVEPNVDQGWSYQTSTLYIKDVDFRPDVYNFEDNPNDRSFTFEYNNVDRKFQFLWVAKKTIKGYSEPIRVLSFELYYFKDKNVGSMSEGYDGSFKYTLEDLHSEFSDNPRVQAAENYVLEEPYYYNWEDNLTKPSENKIINITGTWFIKARNRSGLGNPSLPLYINPNIAISEYDWYLYDNSTLSLIWNHPQHLITLGGPIDYVCEFTNREGEKEVEPIVIKNPIQSSANVAGIPGGSWKHLYLIPGEGTLRIQTYAYGIQPTSSIIDDTKGSNTILTLEISPSGVLGAQKLNDFKNTTLIFRYDYSVRKYYFEFSDPDPQDFVIINLQILDNFVWIGLGLDSVPSTTTGKKRIYIPNFFNRVRPFQDGYWRVVLKLFNDSEVDVNTPKTQDYKNGFVDSIVFAPDNDNNKPRDFNFTFALNSSNEPIITLTFKVPYLPDENTYIPGPIEFRIYIPGPIEFRIYKKTGTTYTLFETFTKNDTASNENVSHEINLTDISPDDIIGTYYVGTFWYLNESETQYYSSITNFNNNSTNILSKLFVSFNIDKPEIPTNFDIVFPEDAHENIKLTWDLPQIILNNKSNYFYDVYIRTRDESLSEQYIAKLYSIPLGQNEDNIIVNNVNSKYEHTIDSNKIFNYNPRFTENSDIITIHVNTGYLCELLIKVTFVCVESEFSDIILLKQPTIPNNDRPPTQMVGEINGRIMKTNEYVFVYDLNNFNGRFLYLKDLQLTLTTMEGDIEYSLLEENFRYVDPEVETPIERIKYHIIRKIDDVSVILTSDDFTSTITYVGGKYPYIDLDIALDALETALETEGKYPGEIALEDTLFILKLDLAYVVVLEGDVTLYLNAFDSLIDIQNFPITFTAEPQPVPKEYEEYEPLEHPLREKTLLDGIDFDITKAGQVFSKDIKTKNIKSSYSYEKNDNGKYIAPVLKIESKSAINLEIKNASEIKEIGERIIFTNGKGLQKALNTIIIEKQIELELSAPYMYIQIIYSDKILFKILDMKLPALLSNSSIDLKFDLYEHNDVRKDMLESDILSGTSFNLEYPRELMSFDDYDEYDVDTRYTVSLSFEILRLGDYGNNSTIFVNNVRVVALENIPLVDSINITDVQIINTIYSQSIYVKFIPHQRILSGIDTTFSVGFYKIDDAVFDINTNIYQDLSLSSQTDFFEFHYQLFNVFDKYNSTNYNNSIYYIEKYIPNSTVKDHQFIQNVPVNESLNFFVKNTLNMNTSYDLADHLRERINDPPRPETSTKDFITLESDNLYYFNFKVENTEYSYDDFIANGKIIPQNKNNIKLTSFLEFHLEKQDVNSSDWDPDFIIYYDHTRNLPTETVENGKKYLEYSIPFGLDDLHDNLKDLITTFNPTSLLVGNWRLKIFNMYNKSNISYFEFEVSPPQLPTIKEITHIGLTKYKIEFVDAIEDSYTFESLHFDSIESDRKSIIIHRFDFSYIVPHDNIFVDIEGHEDDYGPEYPFLIKNALMVYTEIKYNRDGNGNHFNLENVVIVGFPEYSDLEENLESNNIYYYFKLIYLDEIEQNEFSLYSLTPLNWISKEDDIDLELEYNTEDSIRDTIEIYDDTTNQNLYIPTFYYRHTIFFTLNPMTRIIYIDSEEYNLKIRNKNGNYGDGIDFFVKDIVGVDFNINLQRNLLRRSYNSGVAKDRTFKCPYEVRILKTPNFFAVNNIVYDLDCKYWIHAVVDDYEFKENKTLEHFYINVADELYGEKAPTLYSYPSSVIEYKVINDILVLQEMTGTKQTYFDFELSYTFRMFRFIYRQKIPWLSAQEYWNINFDNYTNPHLFARENKFFSPSGDPLNARNYAQHGMYQYVEGFTPITRPKLRIWNGKVSTINFNWSPISEKRGLNYFSYTYNRNTGDYDKTWTISEHFLPIIYKQNREKKSLISRHNVHERINFKPIHSFETDIPYKVKGIHPTSYVPAFIDKIYFDNRNSGFHTQNLPIAQENPEFYGYIRAGDTISSSPMLGYGVWSYEYEVNNVKSGWWSKHIYGEPDGEEPSTGEKRDAIWTPSFYRVNHNTLKELLYNNKDFFEQIKYIIEIKPERCSGYNFQLHLWKKNQPDIQPDIELKSSNAIGVHEDNINVEKYTFFRLEKLSKDPARRIQYAHEKFYVPVKENSMSTRFLGKSNPNPTPIFCCEYLLYTTNDKLQTLLNNQPEVKYLYNGVNGTHPYNDTSSANVGFAPPNGEVLQERSFEYDSSFNPLDYLETYDTPYSQLLFMPYSHYSLPGYHEIYTDYYESVHDVKSDVAKHVVYTNFTNELNFDEKFRVLIYEVEYPSTNSINPVNYFDQNLEQYVWYNTMIGMQSPFTPEMLWGEPNANNIGINNDEINVYKYQFDHIIFEATREFYYNYDGQWDANQEINSDNFNQYRPLQAYNPYNNIKWYHLNTTLTHTPSNLSYTYNSDYPYDQTYPTYGTEGGPPRNTDDSYLYYPWYVDDNESGNGTSRYEFNRDEIVIHIERKTFNGFHLDLYFDHEIWYHDRNNLRTGMNACGMEDGGKKLFLRWTDPDSDSKDVPYQPSEVVKIFKDEFPDLYLNMPSILAPPDYIDDINSYSSPYLVWEVYPYIFTARRLLYYFTNNADIENQHIIHNFFVLCAIYAKNNTDYGITYEYYNIVDGKTESYAYNKLFEDYLMLFIDYYNNSKQISHEFRYHPDIPTDKLIELYHSDARTTIISLLNTHDDDLPLVKEFKNSNTNYKDILRRYAEQFESRYENVFSLIFEKTDRKTYKEISLKSYPHNFSILEHDDILVSPYDKGEKARKFQKFLSVFLGPFEDRGEAGLIEQPNNSRKIDPKKDDPYEYDHWYYFKVSHYSHLQQHFKHHVNYDIFDSINKARLYGKYKHKDYFAPLDIYTNIHLNFRYLFSLRRDTEFITYNDALVWNNELAELDKKRVEANSANSDLYETGNLDGRLYEASNLVIAEQQIKIYEDHAASNFKTRSTYAISELQFGVYPGDPRHDVSYRNLLIDPFKEYFNANDKTLLDHMDYIEEPLQAGPWPSTSNVLKLFYSNWDTKNDAEKELSVSSDLRFSRWRNLKNSGNFANPFVRHEFLRRINTKGYSTHENQQSIEILTYHLDNT